MVRLEVKLLLAPADQASFDFGLSALLNTRQGLVVLLTNDRLSNDGWFLFCYNLTGWDTSKISVLRSESSETKKVCLSSLLLPYYNY